MAHAVSEVRRLYTKVEDTRDHLKRSQAVRAITGTSGSSSRGCKIDKLQNMPVNHKDQKGSIRRLPLKLETQAPRSNKA